MKCSENLDKGFLRVIKATVVGNTTDLTDDVYASFRDTGTAHLIAISGQHFSILIMSIYGVLCALGMARKPARSSARCWPFYMQRSFGFTPSVVRAGNHAFDCIFGFYGDA